MPAANLQYLPRLPANKKNKNGASARRNLKQLTAPDELHNFVAIAVCDELLRQLRARQNFQAALECDPTVVKAEFAQKIRNARARFGVARLAVHGYCERR